MIDTEKTHFSLRDLFLCLKFPPDNDERTLTIDEDVHDETITAEEDGVAIQIFEILESILKSPESWNPHNLENLFGGLPHCRGGRCGNSNHSGFNSENRIQSNFRIAWKNILDLIFDT